MAIFKNISGRRIHLLLNGATRPINSDGLINVPDNMIKLFNKNPDLQMVNKLTVHNKPVPTNNTLTFDKSKPVAPKVSTPKKTPVPTSKPVTAPVNRNPVTQNAQMKEDYIKFSKYKNYDKEKQFLKKKFNEKVSVCILTIDNYDVIKRCIDSIEKYNTYENIEILIGDTGTTDKKVLKLYDSLDKNKYKIFRGLVFNFSKNNNFLVKQSTGDFVLIMNNDVFITHDCISNMVKMLHFYHIGSVGYRLIFDDPKEIIQHDGQTLHNNQRWLPLNHVNINKKVREIPGINSYVNGNTAAFAMYRKEVYNTVKGFDEEYQDIFQDVDINLKVSALGLKHYCIREKHHIHVDHGTRNEGPDMGEERIKEIQFDSNKISNDWLRTKKPPQFNKELFSFIICGTKDNQFDMLCDSLKTGISHEMMVINNKNNIFDNASDAFNLGSELSVSKYNIFCHQDIVFKEKDILDTIATRIRQIEDSDNRWGVLGVAGAGWIEGRGRIFEHYMDAETRSRGNFQKIQTVDEFICIIKNDNMIKYDSKTIDHWHFYGADICLSALSMGLNNYVINANMAHLSDGSENLKNHFEEYKLQCRRMLAKWVSKFPNITTTTMQYHDGEIVYFGKHKDVFEQMDES